MVDDLDNGNKTAGVGAFGELSDTADLDEAPVASSDLRVAHCAGC